MYTFYDYYIAFRYVLSKSKLNTYLLSHDLPIKRRSRSNNWQTISTVISVHLTIGSHVSLLLLLLYLDQEVLRVDLVPDRHVGRPDHASHLGLDRHLHLHCGDHRDNLIKNTKMLCWVSQCIKRYYTDLSSLNMVSRGYLHNDDFSLHRSTNL